MHICIITKKLTPGLCGLADHSLCFSKALRSLGHKVTIISGEGEKEGSSHILHDDWGKAGLSRLFDKLNNMAIDHIVLQYTPLSFLNRKGWGNFDLVNFWKTCSQYWQTSLILHETYFRVWWYPLSWVRGTQQKQLLKVLVGLSRNVFTASQSLVEELRTWRVKSKIVLLPIGSHFPLIQIDRQEIRDKQQIKPEEIVLVLFGGGNALRWASSYVKDLEVYLKQQRIPIRWFLLGGMSPKKFKLTAPIYAPGKLSPEMISALLQEADIFLVPHSCGLTAKRSTLIAGLQHGLPVVGTKGYMTDTFWNEVPGVTLVPMSKPKDFYRAVLNLCTNPMLRQKHGQSNLACYQKQFTWEAITDIFLKNVE